jgi:AcrR family transcriptional regulator
MSEKDGKAQLIIETAQKRFGIYGIEKTSMREIADDLNLSKASLYYYFPDKVSLYRAVVEKEQDEFIIRISDRIITIHEPDRLLMEYAKSRLSYFRSLLNLTRLRLESMSDLKPVFRETLQAFKEKEKEIILRIFEKGTESGIFTIKDPDTTASLFLDLLKGLRLTVVNDRVTMTIEEKDFEELQQNTLAFTEIFIKGLSSR